MDSVSFLKNKNNFFNIEIKTNNHSNLTFLNTSKLEN